jgi:hypothetical protein
VSFDTVATDQFTLAGGLAENPPFTGNGAILIKALSTNAADVQIGSGALVDGHGYILSPGEFVTLDVVNPGKLRVRGTAGDKVTWMTTSP